MHVKILLCVFKNKLQEWCECVRQDHWWWGKSAAETTFSDQTANKLRPQHILSSHLIPSRRLCRYASDQSRLPLRAILYLACESNNSTLTDTRLTASFPGQPGWASTRKVKSIWILMKQEIMGWHWHQLDHIKIICTSLQTDNHASTSSSIFLGRMLFLTLNQQCQST